MDLKLREQLREAVDVDDAPTVIRFAKGGVCEDLPSLERVGTYDVLSRDVAQDVVIVAVGSFGHLALEAAEKIRAAGHGVTVVDPRWVKPIDPALVNLINQFDLAVTVEDNGRHGGVGAAITQAVRDAAIDTPIQVHGVQQEFLGHAKRDVILERLGLTPRAIADDTLAALARNSVAP